MAGTKKEALQRAFEIWYERAHGEKPERGVLCDYIEDEPLMSWIGWEKGFEIGEKSALALNSAAPALLQALEAAKSKIECSQRSHERASVILVDEALEIIDSAIAVARGE